MIPPDGRASDQSSLKAENIQQTEMRVFPM